MIRSLNILTYFFVASLLLSSCSNDNSDTELPIVKADAELPTAPTNIVARNITETSTDLSWSASTDNVGVKEYLIFKGATSIATSTSSFYTVTSLTSNSAYAFKVKAKDDAGNTSGFSSEINVTTLNITPTLVNASGDIETYIKNLINKVPGDAGNNYKVPTTVQLIAWDLIIDAVLADNISVAVLKSSELNYQITEFTDTTLTPNQIFYILEEKSSQSNYWGTYVFSKTPTIDNLILMAPHIKNDTNTGNQAIYCFKNNVAKAVFINGTHRCNSNVYSACSGTTTTCNSGSDPYRVSDLAHNTNSIFQKTTENLFTNIPNSVFVQLHGFEKGGSDPYVIMSNGTNETPSTDYATLIKDALLIEDNTLTFKLAHIDTDWTRLVGFTNTQGRYINKSSDPCSESATTTSGRFIHIEQERTKLRENYVGWMKMSNALKATFK